MAEQFVKTAASAAVRVSRLPTASIKMLRVRGAGEAVVGALSQAIGVDLPLEPNRVGGTDARALWLSPGEWMLVDVACSAADILAAAAGARVAHVADVGEGRCRFAISGPRARDLIATSCPLDLHPARFGPGHCAQSQLAQLYVVIEQRSDEPEFHLIADASVANYLDQWFADALLEFRSGENP